MLNQSHYIYSRRSSTIDFPCDAIPILGHFEGGHFLPDSRQQATFIIPEAFIRGAEFQVDIKDIAYALWLGDAIICTDGSVSQESGTYSLVILMHPSSPKLTVTIHLGGHIPVLAEFLDMDSHRPEAAALLIRIFLVGTIMIECPWPIRPMPQDVWLCFFLDNKSVTTNVDWW